MKTYFAITIGVIAYVNGVVDGDWLLRYPGLLLMCLGLLRLTERA